MRDFSICGVTIALNNIKTYGIAQQALICENVYQKRENPKKGFFQPSYIVVKCEDDLRILGEAEPIAPGAFTRGGWGIYDARRKMYVFPERDFSAKGLAFRDENDDFYIDSSKDDFIDDKGNLIYGATFFEKEFDYLYITTYQNDNYRFYEFEAKIRLAYEDLKEFRNSQSGIETFDEKIAKLIALKNSGIISNEEFEEKRQELLSML